MDLTVLELNVTSGFSTYPGQQHAFPHIYPLKPPGFYIRASQISDRSKYEKLTNLPTHVILSIT